jgi:hypothetical protein
MGKETEILQNQVRCCNPKSEDLLLSVFLGKANGHDKHFLVPFYLN